MKQQIQALLNKQSNLSKICYASLKGLHTNLSEALNAYPEDNAHKEVSQLIKELENIFNSINIKNKSFTTTTRKTITTAETSNTDDITKQIPEIMAFVNYTTNNHISGEQAFIDSLQCYLLHIPFSQKNLILNKIKNTQLKEKVNDMIIQKAEDKNYLHPSVKVFFNQGINEDISVLAHAVSISIEMIEQDHLLNHALYELTIVGYQSFTQKPEHKELYIKKLLNSLKDIINTSLGIEQIKARIQLDTAIHSLIHRALTQNGSHWAEIKQKCRNSLFQAVSQLRKTQNILINLQVLSGNFSTIKDKTNNDVSWPPDNCSTGIVLECLQVWSEINNEVKKGRVLFCGNSSV